MFRNVKIDRNISDSERFRLGGISVRSPKVRNQDQIFKSNLERCQSFFLVSGKWMKPDCVEPWQWPNPVRMVWLQCKKILVRRSEVQNSVPARTLHSGNSVKMYPSSCELYSQFQFMSEMYWLTAHLLYMWEMWHEPNKLKIPQGGRNL